MTAPYYEFLGGRMRVDIASGRIISQLLYPFPSPTRGALAMEILFVAVLASAMATHALSGRERKAPEALGILATRPFLITLGSLLALLAVGFALRPLISRQVWSGGVVARMGRSVFDDLPDGLHVGLAGTGAPMPDTQRVGISTVVVAGEHQFIVDIGPGGTLNLELMQVPL